MIIYMLCENGDAKYYSNLETAADVMRANMICVGYEDYDKLLDRNNVPFDWKMVDNIVQAVNDTGLAQSDDDYIWLERIEVIDY